MAVIEIYHKMSIGIYNIIKSIKYNAVFTYLPQIKGLCAAEIQIR